MNLFKPKYRVIKTETGRYWPQFSYWWSWWSECYERQSSTSTYEAAVDVCRNHKYRKVLKDELE